MKTLKRTAIATILAGIASGPALADSIPASKATFAYNELIALPSAAFTSPDNGPHSASGNSGWTSILKSESKPPTRKTCSSAPHSSAESSPTPRSRAQTARIPMPPHAEPFVCA